MALYAGLSLLALFISAGRGTVDLYRLRADHGGLDVLVGPLLGLGLGLVIVVLSRISVHRFRWARHLHSEFRSILGELSNREMLILALASSVGEELLFRGALLPWLGIWVQAGLFGILHFGPGKRFLPWTISALVMGIVFGYLAQWTGDIGAPIAAHFTINLLNLRFIVRTEFPAN